MAGLGEKWRCITTSSDYESWARSGFLIDKEPEFANDIS